jgi:hypothetical protein
LAGARGLRSILWEPFQFENFVKMKAFLFHLFHKKSFFW